LRGGQLLVRRPGRRLDGRDRRARRRVEDQAVGRRDDRRLGPTFFGGLDVEPAVASTRVPTLFVAASEDAGFDDAARTLHARSVAPGKRLEIVPGADHGYQLVTGTASEPNRRLFGGFLSAHLG
jgi:pimeloyl-ACP methyl ester carboxylesterase